MTDQHLSGSREGGADELLNRGLPAAPEDIYLRHALLMRRIAMAKFHIPRHDAEALVHDVFIRFLVAPRRIDSDVRQYLVAAICNASRNYWRSRRCEERVLAPAEQVTGNETWDPDDLVAGLNAHVLVSRTLARLGRRCREVLRRYYLDGEDSTTLAESLKTTRANVNYLMHVCRKRARTIYEELTRQ